MQTAPCPCLVVRAQRATQQRVRLTQRAAHGKIARMRRVGGPSPRRRRRGRGDLPPQGLTDRGREDRPGVPLIQRLAISRRRRGQQALRHVARRQRRHDFIDQRPGAVRVHIGVPPIQRSEREGGVWVTAGVPARWMAAAINGASAWPCCVARVERLLAEVADRHRPACGQPESVRVSSTARSGVSVWLER